MELITEQHSAARAAAEQLLEFLDIDEPPITPELVMDQLNLSAQALPAFDLDRLTPQQRLNFGSVRALLSPAERRIYLRNDMAPYQKRWPIFHETGHSFIPWHRELLYLDCDYTLSPAVREQMEIEANEFAARLQFLGDRFRSEAAGMEFGLSSALLLKDRYASSIEAGIRHYIETNEKDCMCQVFRVEHGQLRLQYFIRSRKRGSIWHSDCGVKQVLSDHHALVKQLNDNQYTVGSVHEEYVQYPGTLANRQVFYDGHRLFVLESKGYD